MNHSLLARQVDAAQMYSGVLHCTSTYSLDMRVPGAVTSLSTSPMPDKVLHWAARIVSVRWGSDRCFCSLGAFSRPTHSAGIFRIVGH